LALAFDEDIYPNLQQKGEKFEEKVKGSEIRPPFYDSRRLGLGPAFEGGRLFFEELAEEVAWFGRGRGGDGGGPEGGKR